jgi:hypothetical protein
MNGRGYSRSAAIRGVTVDYRQHIFWFEAFEYEMLMEGSSLPKSKRINSRLSLTVASC